MRISDHHLTEVRDRGFTLVEGFLDAATLRAAQQALWDVYPSPERYFAEPEQHQQLADGQFAGVCDFPYPSWSLNRLTVLPDLVNAAERLCGTADIRIYKVELWAKYAGAADYEQAHHRDFGNHMLVVPQLDGAHVQMTTFILLSDVTADDGPTRLVPLEHSREVPLVPFGRPMGELFDHEVAMTGPAGSLVIYTTQVLHRASSITGPGRSRFVMLVDFEPRGPSWTGKQAWPRRSIAPAWVDAMVRMTPRERVLYGFPAPGDRYWDAQTLHDVALRYPGMDMEPYRAAIRHP